MGIDPDDLRQIRTIAKRLDLHRKGNPLMNDLFLRADDIRILAESLVSEKGYHYKIAEEEAKELQGIREFYGAMIESNPDFVSIREIGARIIAEGRKSIPPPEGHLGVYKLLPEIFGFLKSEFGLHPLPDDCFVYASEAVKLELDWPLPRDAGVRIIEPSKPETNYDLEDLLWRAGQRQHFHTWPPRPETTEQARAWFESVAAMLKQHARDLLAGEPGAFRSLAAAAEERERLYVAECERLYLMEHGHPPPPIP